MNDMQSPGFINGFSKMSREEKIDALKRFLQHPDRFSDTLHRFLIQENQELFDSFSENTLSNFLLPFGVAPNFLINDKWYAIPMVTEESSVVAAASKSARFWAENGGFKTEVADTHKVGQIHFEWHGSEPVLQKHLATIGTLLTEKSAAISENMKKRGGGIIDFVLYPTGDFESGLWQLQVNFETVDSMGANYINSCLETMAPWLENYLNETDELQNSSNPARIIMCILSNYTPHCVVKCWVECPIEQLGAVSGSFTPKDFAQRFQQAVTIATEDVYRAVTHNKGIFNGIDAVVIATGNDFRAIEANGHAYAARNGKYSSLTTVKTTESSFRYVLEIPLALGTVGGLTKLHPLAAESLELLGNPNARELMGIVAAAGLANNFMAVTSLVTHGIQKGHMKLHLTNILHQFNATDKEIEEARQFFENKTVSFSEVKKYLSQLRD